MSSFYIVLPSNTHENDLPQKFNIQLPKSLHFNSQWLCGVSSISYPHSWPTISKENDDFIVVKTTDTFYAYDVKPISPSSPEQLREEINAMLSATRHKRSADTSVIVVSGGEPPTHPDYVENPGDPPPADGGQTTSGAAAPDVVTPSPAAPGAPNKASQTTVNDKTNKSETSSTEAQSDKSDSKKTTHSSSESEKNNQQADQTKSETQKDKQAAEKKSEGDNGNSVSSEKKSAADAAKVSKDTKSGEKKPEGDKAKLATSVETEKNKQSAVTKTTDGTQKETNSETDKVATVSPAGEKNKQPAANETKTGTQKETKTGTQKETKAGTQKETKGSEKKSEADNSKLANASQTPSAESEKNKHATADATKTGIQKETKGSEKKSEADNIKLANASPIPSTENEKKNGSAKTTEGNEKETNRSETKSEGDNSKLAVASPPPSAEQKKGEDKSEEKNDDTENKNAKNKDKKSESKNQVDAEKHSSKSGDKLKNDEVAKGTITIPDNVVTAPHPPLTSNVVLPHPPVSVLGQQIQGSIDESLDGQKQTSNLPPLAKGITPQLYKTLSDIGKRNLIKNPKNELIYFNWRLDFQRFQVQAFDTKVEEVVLSPQLAYVLGFKENSVLKPGQVASYPPDLKGGASHFAIYTKDLTENVIVGHELTSLLRIVTIESMPGQVAEKIYDSPMYVKVASRDISSIDIEIRDMSGNLIRFAYGPVIVTLHFKKFLF